MVKLSVVLFYVRIFKIVPVYRNLLWATSFLVISWCIAFNFMTIFSCTPVNKLWDPEIAGACLASNKMFLGPSISNIVIDLILLFFPMPILWKLQLKTSSKILLVGAFAAGYW